MKTRNSLIATLLALVLIAPLLAAGCAKSVNDTVDDAGITTRVKTAFINDPVVGSERIDVATFNGVVTLSGAVKSKDQEAKAIALARSIRGVVDVKSTLQIQDPFTTPRL